VQMDETPADLMASERFSETFRISEVPDGGWTVRPLADRQSSP